MKFYIKKALLLVFGCMSFSLMAQRSTVSFSMVWKNEALELDKNYISEKLPDSVSFQVLKFYVSNVRLFYKGQLSYELPKKCILIDIEKPETGFIEIPQQVKLDSIEMDLGVDSLTNVSGAMGEDLDPTQGMYWTWQSGYINFKIEGVCPMLKTRQHRFQFHIGGYQSPFNTLQKIRLPVTDGVIRVQIDTFLEKIQLSETAEIMSPNQKAVEISKIIAESFK